MPKSLIVFYSRGGTTARVAGSIAAGLGRGSTQVDLCNLRDALPPRLDSYDLLGVGTPAYYFGPASPVADYLAGLPDLDGLPAFAFVLYGTNPGNAGNDVRRALVRKGAREVGYWSCHAADVYLGFLREGYLFSPDRPSEEDLAQAEAFGRQVAACVGGGVYAEPPMDPPPSLLFRVERFLTNRWLAAHLYSPLFIVDAKRCITCGLCIRECPTRNLSADPDGRPRWGRNCLLCLACEMVCPEDAISSPAGWPLVRAVYRAYAHQVCRDPSIEYVRVEHRRGRTRRLDHD